MSTTNAEKQGMTEEEERDYKAAKEEEERANKVATVIAISKTMAGAIENTTMSRADLERHKAKEPEVRHQLTANLTIRTFRSLLFALNEASTLTTQLCELKYTADEKRELDAVRDEVKQWSTDFIEALTDMDDYFHSRLQARISAAANETPVVRE